jgi:hypothetical protein
VIQEIVKLDAVMADARAFLTPLYRENFLMDIFLYGSNTAGRGVHI